MRRMIAALAMTLTLGALLPSTASARQGEELIQSQAGSILMLTRFTDAEGGFPGLARRVYLVAAEANGIVGYVFPVDPATWGGRFDLTVQTQQAPPGDADLGIYLYSDLGDIATQSRLPVTTAEYDVRAAGGEKGFIPPTTTYAIVFMTRGVNVAFNYNGYSPQSVEVSEAGFTPAEITVGAGGYVYWENIGEEFHSVSSATFDSSPTLKKPMRPGDVFSVQFLEVGDYAYTDKFGEATGVVHVVPGPGPGIPAS